MIRPDLAALRPLIDQEWERAVLPSLQKYVAIPALSPGFDEDWRRNGHLDRSVTLVRDWIEARGIPGVCTEVLSIDEASPVLFVDLPGSRGGAPTNGATRGDGSPGAAMPGEASDALPTVLFYSHLDKQPAGEGWSPGLGPWTPVLRDGKLYGRGAADDGYAAFAPFAAITALRTEGLPYPRCVFLIETCEESGTFDLEPYVHLVRKRLGQPSLVVILDSGAGDYERCWVTTSLRGSVSGVLEVSSVAEGIHSGDASGIVPSSFRIARMLLDRIEDVRTGEIRLPEFHAPVPEARREEVRRAAAILGGAFFEKFRWREGALPVSSDPFQLMLNRGWTPQLEVTGAEGIPPFHEAGNVLRPRTALKLSIRIPPGSDAQRALHSLKRVLESDPPYGAHVRYEGGGSPGWSAPLMEPWLEEAIRAGSVAFFGDEPAHLSEGGSLPLLNMLGEELPSVQFLITGVLGPGSNAHGPDEHLNLGCAKAITGVLANVLVQQAAVRDRAPSGR